jgi:hypothetical protein
MINHQLYLTQTDHSPKAQRFRHRSILVWNIIFTVLHHLPTQFRFLFPYLWPQANDLDWLGFFRRRRHCLCLG